MAPDDGRLRNDPNGLRAQEGAEESRLESWSAIASYFDRSVRTVQHWEKREGMPVHRAERRKWAAVFALRSELDAWWESRRTSLGPRPAIDSRARHRLAVVSAILIVAAIGARRLLTPAPDVGVVLRRSVAPSSYRVLGRPSPDGRVLSFSTARGELALFDLTTRETRILTDSDEVVSHSALSPDGRLVAFAVASELRGTSLDGSPVRTLYRAENGAEIAFVDWSPTGRDVLAGWAGRMGLVSVEDGSVRILKTFDGRAPLGMSLSPDGRYLAYDFPTEPSNRDIHLLDVATGTDRVVVSHGAHDVYPFWSADGGTLVFASDRAGSFGVWMLSVRDGVAEAPPVVVRKDMGRFLPLGLTRDGACYYELSSGLSDVYVASLDSETANFVDEENVGRGLDSSWSGDGKYLAYLSQRGYVPGIAGYRILVVRSLETGAERELAPELPSLEELRWVPSAERILVRVKVGYEAPGIYSLDLETGKTELVVSGDVGRFEISRDGKQLFLARGGTLLRHDLETGTESRLDGPEILSFTLSPDGSELAYQIDAAIYVMPSGGGLPRQIFEPEGEEGRIALQAWGRDLLVTRPDGSVWRVPLDGGAVQATGLAREGLRGLRLHPDGRRVAFTAGRYSSELWVLESFLPEP